MIPFNPVACLGHMISDGRRNTRRIKSFFPYQVRLSRSLRSKIVYKASCLDCDECYIGKTKRRLHDRKTEHFKALTTNSHSSANWKPQRQTRMKLLQILFKNTPIALTNHVFASVIGIGCAISSQWSIRVFSTFRWFLPVRSHWRRHSSSY